MERTLSIFVGRAALAAALVFSLSSLGGCAGSAKPAEAPVQAAPAPKKLDLAALIGAKDSAGIKEFFGNRELLDTADAEGSYPLHRAVEQDAPDIVELLLALGAKPDPVDAKGRTPLRLAVDKGGTASAKVLAERGASLFSKDSSGTTVAQAALSKAPGGGELFAAVFTAKTIGQRDAEGSTVLHLAADSLLEEPVRLLLDAGADPAAKNAAGHTALDMALLHPDRVESARIAELLILRGSTTSFPEFAWFTQAVKAMNYGGLRYEDGNTPLHEATARKQKGFVSFLISRKVNPNVRNGAGSAPLHEAMRAGWLEGAELLLAGGADPNVRDGFDNTPLHIALPEAGREEGVALLIRHGADPSLKDKNGNIPLHIAVEVGYPVSLVETLLKAGSNVNAANAAGDTPLHIALRSGRLEYAPPLLASGADIFLANGRGESPLAVAIAACGGVVLGGGEGAASGLDDGCAALGAVVTPGNVSGRDNLGNAPLAIAVSLRAPQTAIALIVSRGADVNARNNSGDTSLAIAVRRNLQEQGEALLAAKADIFASNVKGETPLSIALSSTKGPVEWLFDSNTVGARDANGDTPLHHAARLNLPAAIDFLGQKGADSGAKNGDGTTPLASAVKADASAAVKALIARGASLEARDVMGDTPLHDAVLWSARNSLPLLVAAGAKPNARNSGGETPLHLAVRKNDLESIHYLAAHGASLELRDNRGATPLFLAAKAGGTDIASFLVASGADLEARDQTGRVPLAVAVDSGDASTVKLLVGSGASIVALDAGGASPLSIASRRSLSLLELLLLPSAVNKADSEGKAPLRILVDLGAAPEAVDLALAKGARLDARDRYSATALLAALKSGQLDMASKLASAGADLFAADKDGATPVSVAVALDAAAAQAALKAILGTDRINAADPAGDSVLHYAARAGKPEAAAWLLAAGADKSARNLLGETAADLAAKRGYGDLAASLK